MSVSYLLRLRTISTVLLLMTMLLFLESELFPTRKYVWTNRLLPSTPAFKIINDPSLIAKIETLPFKLAFISVLVESYTNFCEGGRVENEPLGASTACKDTFGDNKPVFETVHG